ncbi:hypothetical protein [Paraclostridium sordellii]|uniref:hypothetical protein n=1 Tax=Paraclostridium sordellii TaxID=1505 RepID=UPI0005E7D8EE|nr:hypothetical protein [Paeniclostridium sordellii]CEQ14861.1 Uncharacterised protein [[Clostridium] sordellii] [Paeniclostridium sordellii]
MSSSTTLYYAKVNLNSSHIFDVYDQVCSLEDVLKKLYNSISKGIAHKRVDEYNGVETYRANYSFENIEKNEDEVYIYGTVVKKSDIYANQRDKDDKPIKVPVENEEYIKFYFDVLNETIVFHTTNRFGYMEFIEAISILLNTSINNVYGNEDECYHFDVSLKRCNLNIEDIKEELKRLKYVETLKIDIIPPNPDPDILDEIRKNGEERLEYLKNGNVTYKSTLLQSKSSTGIVLDSDIVNKELDEAVNLHSKLSSEDALNKGYIQVEAVSREGGTYSTKDNQPIKQVIDKYHMEDFESFVSFCKRSIKALFN